MRYLIARHIRMFASCLADYSNTYDIIPDILRLAIENPLENTFNIKSKAQLKRINQLLGTVEKDVERADKEGITIQRPERRPVQTDKDLMKLFSTGDMLLKKVAELAREEETSPQDTLLPIIQSLNKGITSISDEVEKEKKKLTVQDHSVINEIAGEMRVYPSRIVAFIQSKRKKTAKVEKKIFCDLDGVLTDFNGAVRDLRTPAKSTTKPEEGLAEDATQEQKQVMYDAIEDAGADFWSGMKWLPDGKKVWDLVKDKNPVLLSSPGKFRFAPAGKEIWVKENLPGISLFLDTDKYQYAEMDSILIDDNKENCSAWKEAGGEDILHESAEKTEEELKKLLN